MRAFMLKIVSVLSVTMLKKAALFPQKYFQSTYFLKWF